MDATNASRFLKSYNNIEECLRRRYNVKASQSFTDLINRCTDIDPTVRRYKDLLIDCGKLRNAIVHKTKGERIIAYPCDDIVEDMELIEKSICTPPFVVDVLRPKKIMFVYGDMPVRQAMIFIAKSKHSSLPVYEKEKVIGVINSHSILDHIVSAMEKGIAMDDFLKKTPCREIFDLNEIGKEYKFLPVTATIFETFRSFEVGKKTLAIFFTETGTFGEKIENMLTASDLPLLNKFIENF